MPDEVKILEGIFERKQKEKKKDEPDEYWEKSQKKGEKPADEAELFDDTSKATETILQSAEEPADAVEKPESTEEVKGDDAA